MYGVILLTVLVDLMVAVGVGVFSCQLPDDRADEHPGIARG